MEERGGMPCCQPLPEPGEGNRVPGLPRPACWGASSLFLLPSGTCAPCLARRAWVGAVLPGALKILGYVRAPEQKGLLQASLGTILKR